MSTTEEKGKRAEQDARKRAELARWAPILKMLRRRREQSLTALARTDVELRAAVVSAQKAGIPMTIIANLVGVDRTTIYTWTLKEKQPK